MSKFDPKNFLCDHEAKPFGFEFPLILREVAAIGIRLSHASQGVSSETPANCSVTRQ